MKQNTISAIEICAFLLFFVLIIAPILQQIFSCIMWLRDGYWTDFHLIELLNNFGFTDMQSMRTPTSWAGINKIINWLLDAWFGWTSYLLALVLWCFIYGMSE